MIGKTHRAKLMRVVSDPDIEIFADQKLLNEFREVAYREKFRRYVTVREVELFIEVMEASFSLIEPTTEIIASPDPNDNYLLSLAVDSQSEYLITGNKRDLLDLSPFREIKIVRLQTFLDLFY